MDSLSFCIGLVIGLVLPFGIAPLYKQLKKAYDEIRERTS